MPEQAAALEGPELERFARAALAEVVDPRDVGPFVATRDEGDHATTALFETNQPGYPGWKWSITIAQLPGAEPTVLESELVPGDGSLLAPDWLPWSERLEEWRAAQAAAGEQLDDGDDADADLDDEDDADSEESDDDAEDDEELDEDDDELDSDIDPDAVLHGGDYDGVEPEEADPESAEPAPDEGDDVDDDDADTDQPDDEVEGDRTP